MKTEHLINWLFVVCLLLLNGCSAAMMPGDVLELGAGTTARGLELVRSGAVGTYVITDGKLIFALWPQSGNIGAVCIDAGCPDPMGQWRYLTGGRGMYMSWQSASDLVTFLKNEHAWYEVAERTIPGLQAASQVGARMGAAITGFMVVPGGGPVFNQAWGEPGAY